MIIDRQATIGDLIILIFFGLKNHAEIVDVFPAEGFILEKYVKKGISLNDKLASYFHERTSRPSYFHERKP